MTVRGTLVETEGVAWDLRAWRRRLKTDVLEIERRMPPELQSLHDAVVERARAGAASSLVLSGSTARGHRTAISDLDYHLVGPRIHSKDLSRELDLHVLSKDKLRAEILAGDDFVQWSLRFGRIVFDDGTLRRSLKLLSERRPWPDVARKRAHAAKSLDLARRFVATGDDDGALVQVRTALSLTARAHLLDAGIFPLSRAEMPAQLANIGCDEAARALEATIYQSPSLDELALAVQLGQDLIAGQ